MINANHLEKLTSIINESSSGKLRFIDESDEIKKLIGRYNELKNMVTVSHLEQLIPTDEEKVIEDFWQRFHEGAVFSKKSFDEYENKYWNEYQNKYWDEHLNNILVDNYKVNEYLLAFFAAEDSPNKYEAWLDNLWLSFYHSFEKDTIKYLKTRKFTKIMEENLISTLYLETRLNIITDRSLDLHVRNLYWENQKWNSESLYIYILKILETRFHVDQVATRSKISKEVILIHQNSIRIPEIPGDLILCNNGVIHLNSGTISFHEISKNKWPTYYIRHAINYKIEFNVDLVIPYRGEIESIFKFYFGNDADIFWKHLSLILGVRGLKYHLFLSDTFDIIEPFINILRKIFRVPISEYDMKCSRGIVFKRIYPDEMTGHIYREGFASITYDNDNNNWNTLITNFENIVFNKITIDPNIKTEIHFPQEYIPSLLAMLIEKYPESYKNKNKFGLSVLKPLIEEDRFYLFRRLIKDVEKLDEVDILGNTALHYSVLFKRYRMIDLLLRSEVDTTIENLEGKSPYHLALDNDEKAFTNKDLLFSIWEGQMSKKYIPNGEESRKIEQHFNELLHSV